MGWIGRPLFRIMDVVSALALTASAERAFAVGAEPAREALRLALVDCAEVPAIAERVLEAEARAILAPHGRQLRWRRVRPQAELEAGEVPVILLAGEYPVRRDRGAVLGGFEPRAVPPAVWVYTRAVGRVIGLPGPPPTADLAAQRALGVALGRVVAHEVVHAVAPELSHTKAGLMAPVYDRQALVGPRPRLDPAMTAGYRAGLARWLASGPGTQDRPDRTFFEFSQGRAPTAIVKNHGDASAVR
jgi:hypothetical protein